MSPAEIDLMASVEVDHWWYRGLRDAIGQSLRSSYARIPAAARILDAGCGTGENLKFLKQLLNPAYAGGFDLSPLAVSRSRAKVPGADVYLSDIRDPQIHIEDLDLVLSCDVVSIAGIDDSGAGLSRLVAHMRPGGTMILNLPAFAWLRSRHDVSTCTRERVTVDQVRRLLRGLGLAIEVVSYRVFSLLPAIVLARLPSILLPARDPEGAPVRCSDLKLTPRWIDPALFTVLHAENALIVRGMRFPWGSSVYAVARKP